MKYEYNGKNYNIPDAEIDNYVDMLGISIMEAIDLWLEDNGHKVNEEQEALNAKAKASVKIANLVQARAAAPKTQRERVKKDDPTKEGIIAALAAALPELAAATDIEVLNKGKLIQFKVGEDTYKLDLTRSRKPKA